DPHAGVDPIEDRRRHEVAAIEAAVGNALAAANQTGALLAADVDVVEHGLELPLVDRRPDVRAGIEAVADHERRRPRLEPLEELVGDRLDDHRPARRGAALAGRSERALHRTLDRDLEVGVAEDHDRVLAAHLALALDAARRGVAVEADADL